MIPDLSSMELTFWPELKMFNPLKFFSTMASKKTTAKGAKGAQKANKADKANEKNITPESATIEQVVETVECVDLTMFVKKSEMRLGESRRGRLKKRGKYDYKFVERGADIENQRPWEVRVKLAEEKPYARISANSNGGFMGVYVPRENFQNNREFLEALLDTTELLVEKMDGVDTIGVIDHLRALKRKILEAYV